MGDRASGGFRTLNDKSNDKPKSGPSKTFERIYDNKSPSELRQLAKGALLSLVPHKILYADLVKEGIHPQVLKELYGELGIKTDADPTQIGENVDATPAAFNAAESVNPHLGGSFAGPSLQSAESREPETQNLTGVAASNEAQAYQSGVAPSQALLEVPKQQSAPSPNLERKDRIAQLLAAKTGRPTPTTPGSASPSQREDAVPAASAVRTVHTPTSAPRSPVQPENGIGQQPQHATVAKAQPDVVKAKMEQLKREAEARSQNRLPHEAQVAPDNAAAAATQAAPNFGSASQLQSRLAGSAVTSMIPGLFMTPSELASMDIAEASEDTEMADTREKDQTQTELGLALGAPTSPPSSVPQTRPLSLDPALLDTEHQPKRTHVEVTTQDLPVDSDEQSEGEIIEGDEGDSMAGPQGFTGEYGGASTGQETSASGKVEISRADALTAAQNNLANDAGKEELYRAKQSEIEAMRRRIAEMEQRNKLKRSRSQVESPASSNPPTPVMTKTEQPLSSSPVSHLSAPPIAGIQSKQNSSARTIAKLTPAQLAERAAALKADLLRQRAQRQQVLQDGLPDLNFEVSKIEDRLAKAKKELDEAEARVAKCRAAFGLAIKVRDDLLEETAQLEKQLQEGQSGQKQYADELHQIKLERLADAQASTTQEAAEAAPSPEIVDDTASHPVPVNNDGPAADSREELPDVLKDSSPQVDAMGIEETDAASNQLLSEAQMSVSPADEASPQEPAEQDLLEEGIPRADTFQTDEMEISPEPEAPIEQVRDVVSDLEQPSDDTPMNMDDDSDGSASMSDSDDEQEEDYEPAETHISQEVQQPGDDSDEYDPEEAPVEDATPNTGMDNDEEDFYEPSEHVEDLEAQPSPEVPQETAEPPEAVSTVPLDNEQNDIESGPQLTEANIMVTTQGAPNGDTSEDKSYLDGGSAPVTRFVPYKTPLSAFKTFRFHQDYNDTVKSGYRSLTYSNNIDPSRPLCPTELSGENCSDPTCEEQHFRQIGLPGMYTTCYSAMAH